MRSSAQRAGPNKKSYINVSTSLQSGLQLDTRSINILKILRGLLIEASFETKSKRS